MNIILRDQLSYMNKTFEVYGITSWDNKHYNEIKQREGIKMIPITMTRTISPLKDIIALYKLFVTIRRIKPDIVHTHTPKAGLLGMIAAYLNNVPVRLHTVAGLPLLGTSGIKRKLLMLAEQLTFFCAQIVLPNSKGLASILTEEKLCSKKKIQVVAQGSSNGIDTKYFSRETLINTGEFNKDLRNQLQISDDDFVFCFVGRLAQEKGITELIDAFIKVSSISKIKLLLVGPFEETYGKLEEDVRAVISESDNIVYVGRHDDIRPYLFISDTFVFPSYREGFPNVLLQAGAMELPCIASNINGCNEIIDNNNTGVLFEPNDIGSLYNAMSYSINNILRMKEMAQNSKARIVQNYERSTFINELLEVYKGALRIQKRGN